MKKMSNPGPPEATAATSKLPLHHIELGHRVKDIVSGVVGIATSVTSYLNGCDRVCVSTPVLEDGTAIKEWYFDVHQLRYVDDGVCEEMKEYGEAKPEAKKDTGGPHSSNPPSSFAR